MCDKNAQDTTQWNRAATVAAAAGKNSKISENMPELVTNANIVQTQPHLYENLLAADNVYAAAVGATTRYSPLVQSSAIDSSGKLGNTIGSSGFVAPFPAAISPALEMSSNPYAADMLKKVKAQQMDFVKKMHGAIDEQNAGSSVKAAATEAETVSTIDKSYGVIPTTLAEHVLNVMSAPPNTQVQASVAPVHGRIFGVGVTKELDVESLRCVQQLVESGVSDYAKQNITKLLESISALRPLEKLLLYLRLPADSPEIDPLRQPQNPLGTRSEINHTINWVRTHLEHDPQVSIPKQDVYDDYILYCERLQLKPLSTADFGKVMKQVFPGIRPRRLGTRGHSRYCYAAMRKSTSLLQPQLPNLGEHAKDQLNADETHAFETQTELKQEHDEDSWQIIQSWSEKILNVRAKNAKELAAIIKTQTQQDAHKKFNATVQRQSKEKHLQNDIGPLKKRRKKKRKGSSSSESSTATTNNPNNNDNLIRNALKKEEETSSVSLMEMNMLNIKQEVTELPTQQQINFTQQTNFSPTQQNFQLQYQQAPMNLAADKHASANAPIKLIRPAMTTITTTTLANEAQKLMQLSPVPVMQNVPIISSTTPNIIVPTIKEEIIEESQTPTIFCKKVLKAHQTKGFWVNTTTNATNTNMLPLGSAMVKATTTTTTAANSAILPVLNVEQQQQQAAQQAFPMGPPAHMANSVSTSPLAVLSDHLGQTSGNFANNMGPRVASRNILLLRAKRQMALAKAAAVAAMSNTAATPTPIANNSSSSVVEEAAELPENLGLPRERVISICNMDKHELDDYFLPEQEEEESQEDQDTELLQYFQTGDAEEKLNNSLDANKRNPTATAAAATANTINFINTDNMNEQTSNNNVLENTAKVKTIIANNNNNNDNKDLLPIYSVVKEEEEEEEQQQQQLLNIVSMKAITTESIENVVNTTTSTTTTTTTSTLIKPTVGSASASLALLSRKHQLKQQQQQQNELKIQPLTTTTTQTINKDNNNLGSKQFKVYLNNNADNGFVNGRNKNRIFVPISPNLALQQKQVDVFASPKLSSRSLFKQQSLNTDDSSDPMIGATRRKRTFNTMTTSASAPPSPSILQQQQEQKRRQFQQTVWLQNQNDAATALLNQNSLDFDIFGMNNELQVQQLDQNIIAAATTTTTTSTLFDIEAQRSQSVPVTQQQRMRSPLTKKLNDYYVDEQQSTTAEACLVPSTSSSLLDDVDYSVMLSSPEFMSKFDCLTQSSKTAVTNTAYCSSSTSSSGYSSSAYSCNVSRSVPSTPLPVQLNLFDSYNSQRKLQNSPITGVVESENFPFGNVTSSITDAMHVDDVKNAVVAGLLNYGHDFSKSMPTTPIATHCFRYSPNEFSRDFLINGNTLDSFNNITASDITMSAADKITSNSFLSVGVNVDSLINDNSVNLDSLCNDSNNTNDASVILRGRQLLNDF